MTEYQNILVERNYRNHQHIALVQLNRPKVLNALSTDLMQELLDAFLSLEDDPSIRVIILTGNERAFAAGADIAQLMKATPIDQINDKRLRIWKQLSLITKPVIAAVNGFALGGGCELAMACDIRIASTKAKFGQPEVGLGVTPGFGGTVRLSRLVGPAKAKELIYTGNIIKADEALGIGLVNSVSEPEELMGAAMEMANKISSNAQLAVRYSKQSINRSFETDVETAMEIERNLFGLCFSTEDQKEGMKAFGEKRKPDFKVK